ncbi:hypothetical protein JCM10908_000117 [Rhodotorula pacifica]|uniref:uncharacterized protein n=1 Tax=Rhodotorula pacifica TaxID=1495444 RepID=UPI003173C4D8
MAVPLQGYKVAPDGWHVFGFPALSLLFYTKDVNRDGTLSAHAGSAATRPHEDWPPLMFSAHCWVLNFGVTSYAKLLSHAYNNLIVQTLGRSGARLTSYTPPHPVVISSFGVRTTSNPNDPFTTILPALSVDVGLAELNWTTKDRRDVSRKWLLPSPGSIVPSSARVPGRLNATHTVAGPRYIQVRTYRRGKTLGRDGNPSYGIDMVKWPTRPAARVMELYRKDLNSAGAGNGERVRVLPTEEFEVKIKPFIYRYYLSQLGNPLIDMLCPNPNPNDSNSPPPTVDESAESLPRSVDWGMHLTWTEIKERQREMDIALHFTLDWPPYHLHREPVTTQATPIARDPTASPPRIFQTPSSQERERDSDFPAKRRRL